MIENEMTVSVPLEVVKASEIEPKEVKWLWYPYIPFGKVTLLQGDPGDGKSKLMLSIAALLSKGEPLPFTETEENEPMTIIYQTTEDDADDTVVPRFNSAGGNGENLIFIKEDEKSLSFGDNRIAEAIEKYHARLLILDPMSSYIGENCSMNNANETRAEFNHLIAVAKDTGCAIVIIAHMNKMRDTNPLYRTNGSIDIAGAARSILAITRTPNKEAPAERYLVQVKSNLAPTGSAILFEVSEKGVDFISEMDMTAEEAFQSLAPKIGRPNDKEVKAKAFLIEMLKDGEMLSSDCEEKLEAAGFRKSTIVNQMLPDEPGTKVNQCVDNIMQIWRDGKADKLTQLVFCDISTPQAKAPASKAAKTLDNPLLHALEGAVPLPEQEPVFTVYDDIRQKLIAQGMPADQIAFIHEANTEVRKKELFSKVRTGQVRVLLGSTAKMGAGTNVQDRLVALHDLDCPWRPGDLAQRKGRIERQGNQNPLVHVYRYVTEGTFDAYLWQTVENKQKFISQIMTSKSPVRSCDDVDETALSFAEIKALCAGDPRIKERMDLDVEVSRLKLMKADHQSKQYRLEDQLLKYFPEEIEKHKGFIKGFESDLEVLAAHPHPEDGFAGMEIRGDLLTDKENAGAALLDACKEVKTSDSVQIGSYRGFTMLVEFEAWKQEYTLLLKGQMTHRATLGTDPRGNLTRIDNALAQMPQRLEAVKNQLENLYQQQAAAKEEVGKPFLYEEELRSKNARLVELDTLLNIDGKRQAHTESVVAKSTRPSVLDNLKRPVQPRSTDKKPKQHEEVR